MLWAYLILVSRPPRSCSASGVGHLHDPRLASVHEDLRDRLRKRDDVLFLQAVRGVDPREGRDVLEDVDEDMVFERRRDRGAPRFLGANNLHSGGLLLRGHNGRRGWRRSRFYAKRGATESIGPRFPQQRNHVVEEESLLGGEVRDLDLRAAGATRCQERQFSFAVREDLVTPLADLSEFVLQKERFRGVRVLLGLFVRGFFKSADVRGQPIVEIRLEAHEGLLAALLAVHLRDALKIDLLLTRHVVHIRRPIFDGFRLATLIARGLIGWTLEGRTVSRARTGSGRTLPPPFGEL